MVPPVSDPRWRNVVTRAAPFQPTMLTSPIPMKRLR